MVPILLISAIVTLLTVRYVFQPVLRANDQRKIKDQKLADTLFKLKAIWTFYPKLNKFTYQEIDSRYGANNLYNQIGKNCRSIRSLSSLDHFLD